MKNKFPALNTILGIANVVSIIIAIIALLLLLGVFLEGIMEEPNVFSTVIKLGVSVFLLFSALIIRLSVEMAWVFLEIEKNTRKEQPDIETPGID